MNDILGNIWDWIREDFKVNSIRFVLEVFAWILSIACALTMALTVPNPPMLTLYPIWITGCVIYAWASWSRNSFGMLANYILIIIIDCVGLSRILLS